MPSYVLYADLDDLCIHSLRRIQYTFTNRGTSWTWRWNEVQRMASREPVGLNNGVWNAEWAIPQQVSQSFIDESISFIWQFEERVE